MLKYITAVTLLSLVVFPEQNPLPKAPVTDNTPSKVAGLELPKEVIVNGDSAFTKIQAKTDGEVKWLVLSEKAVQYLEDSENKSIILSKVPENANLHIFAVASVNGKLTDFASTKIVKTKNISNKKESEPEKLDYRIRWY
jgi:hypothetical protein